MNFIDAIKYIKDIKKDCKKNGCACKFLVNIDDGSYLFVDIDDRIYRNCMPDREDIPNERGWSLSEL